jgi:hypothetical protein
MLAFIIVKILEEPLHGFEKDRDKFRGDFMMDHEKVWSYACLASVEELPKDKFFAGGLDLDVLVYDARTFSSKFQNTRSKILRSSRSNILSSLGASSKHNQIKVRRGALDRSLHFSFKASVKSGIQKCIKKCFLNP